MPGGLDSYAAAIIANGPVGWWRFSELLAGSPTTAGSQDPADLCLDSSGGGALNNNALPYGNFLQYGSALIANSPSVLTTRGAQPNYDNGSALFPSTATTSTANIITGGSAQPTILQPTAAISVEAWHVPNVIVGSALQILACYGTDASSAAAYKLYHTGSSASNHQFIFAVNIAGTVRTVTATLPLLVVGSKYHVVGTYNGVTLAIYVNGVSQNTGSFTGAISYAGIGAFGLAFGNDPSNSDGNLQGYLDEVAIYNYALSATRVAYDYRQGSVIQPFVWRH